MTHYRYLIIGGGMTSAAAADGIREVDSTGNIGLISAEHDAPYDRPPLTKGLWKGKALDSIWWDTKKKGVTMHLAELPERSYLKRNMFSVTTKKSSLMSDSYWPPAVDLGACPSVATISCTTGQSLITADCARSPKQVSDLPSSAAGFIGSEISAALAMNGKEVVMIFPDSDISARVFPPPLARFVSDFYRNKGIEVLTGQQPIGVEPRDGR